MKLTQLYNTLNEANEAILAQGACKNAIFMSQKHINKLLKQLEKLGLINGSKTQVKVYNQGYELDVRFKPNYEALAQVGDRVSQKVFALNTNIYIQPESFFESYLKDDGKATITSRSLPINGAMSYDEKYPKYVVKSKSDIKKVQKLFSDMIKQQCDDVAKQLDA